MPAEVITLSNEKGTVFVGSDPTDINSRLTRFRLVRVADNIGFTVFKGLAIDRFFITILALMTDIIPLHFFYFSLFDLSINDRFTLYLLKL